MSAGLTNVGSTDSGAAPGSRGDRGARVLVVLPSWVGDTAMATPTLRLLRDALERAVIVGLGRPGMDELLAGTELLDDVMIADSRSLLGPAKVAGRLRPMRFDAALLLPNSFATAMTARLASIPVRVGYDRDGRGLLLTDTLDAPRRVMPLWSGSGWAPIPQVEYYLRAGRRLLDVLSRQGVALKALNSAAPGLGVEEPLLMRGTRLELGISDAQEAATLGVMARAGLEADEPFALINPGGNNPDKRWPVERFAAVAHHLVAEHRLRVVLNGSPGEAALVRTIADAIALNHPEDERRISCLPELGITIGSLKGIVRRARVMITNDTGPRHMAAAFGVRCVTLFGPTDPRWTTLPDGLAEGLPDGLPDSTPSNAARPRETLLIADPTLPPDEVCDEHPERCRIDKIGTREVIAAVESLLVDAARTG